MAALPAVVHPLTLPALLQLVLAPRPAAVSTTLVVCASRDVFVRDLARALELQHEHDGGAWEPLVAPTLHNLLGARHVDVCFCASVQTLLAYLAAHRGAAPEHHHDSRGAANRRIVLVNPLSLHAPTPSFSAQGLSRTFAAAVETANRARATLVIAECQKPWSAPSCESEGGEAVLQRDTAEDPWEQQLSLLNVSAKRVASGNADRAWVGRTVTARRIAGRWFRFCTLETLHKLSMPG